MIRIRDDNMDHVSGSLETVSLGQITFKLFDADPDPDPVPGVFNKFRR